MTQATLAAIYETYLACGGQVSTDTRNLPQGVLFFCLKGPKFDANLFAAEALANGAASVVTDNPTVAAQLPPNRCHWVADSLACLQALARHHRRQLGTRILGLTGSNGKTTTKELLRAALAELAPVFATPGNLNNHIGLPLSLLQLRPQHQYAILEMGDNQPGDIRTLCEIAEPDDALITNIQHDHLGGYADMEANAQTKFELYDWWQQNQRQGLLFVHTDDPYCARWANTPQAVTYGSTAGAWLRGEVLAQQLSGLTIASTVDGVPLPHLATQLYGRYNLPNFLAALAVGLRVGPEVATPTQTQLTPESLVKVLFKGLSSYVATNNRSQLLQLVGGKTAILDAYNANPDSMELALRSVAEVAPGRWAAVVGDMLELGPESHHLHQAVGLLLNELRPTYVVFVGNEMRAAADVYAAGPFMWASQTDNLPEFALEQALRGADTLLFKASRGTRLDTLYQGLPSCQTTE